MAWHSYRWSRAGVLEGGVRELTSFSACIHSEPSALVRGAGADVIIGRTIGTAAVGVYRTALSTVELTRRRDHAFARLPPHRAVCRRPAVVPAGIPSHTGTRRAGVSPILGSPCWPARHSAALRPQWTRGEVGRGSLMALSLPQPFADRPGDAGEEGLLADFGAELGDVASRSPRRPTDCSDRGRLRAAGRLILRCARGLADTAVRYARCSRSRRPSHSLLMGCAPRSRPLLRLPIRTGCSPPRHGADSAWSIASRSFSSPAVRDPRRRVQTNSSRLCARARRRS